METMSTNQENYKKKTAHEEECTKNIAPDNKELERIMQEKRSLENIQYDQTFRGENDRHNVLLRAKEVVDKLREESIEEVIFLDKSARLLGYFISKIWDATTSNNIKPGFSFLNIGREKTVTQLATPLSEINPEQFSQITKSERSQLLEIFGMKLNDKKICVIDEFCNEGDSLLLACRLIKEACPSSEVYGEWFSYMYRPKTSKFFKILTEIKSPQLACVNVDIFSSDSSGVFDPSDKSSILSVSWGQELENETEKNNYADKMKNRRQQLSKLALELID